ncbi:dihydrofolate reductase [Capnocytophaga sp. ARDL2]|uniref:dipeptidyl-peptidase 3 family protein n=1 Tax=Capnocytophaga sp. ARDL2 TaxID=3238809 RepID=UPI0035573E54
MKNLFFYIFLVSSLLFFSCNKQKANDLQQKLIDSLQQNTFHNERIGDIELLKYEVPGWKKLSLKKKTFIYYLSQAGYSGRDIYWDQNYRNNLKIRTALESIYTNFQGDKTSEKWKEFDAYIKRIWYSNGIHHHYSNDKIKPAFSQEYLLQLLKETDTKLDESIVEILFNESDAKKTNLDESKGVILGSAINFYGKNINQKEVDKFYNTHQSEGDFQKMPLGLNSKLLKNKRGELEEKVWKLDGMYSSSIEKIIYWLEKAIEVAENEQQIIAIRSLISYYQTGDLTHWNNYNIAWLQSNDGDVDFTNGFIEVYNDPLGRKGTYESIVFIKDFDMSNKMQLLSKHAQWFEDNMPIDEQYKKEDIELINFNSVVVIAESGSSSPTSPIGVNLPNTEWIRKKFGSKSMFLGNIIDAYNKIGSEEKWKEFYSEQSEWKQAVRYEDLIRKIQTVLHEVIGRASGKSTKGNFNYKEALKNYHSVVEEGKADLIALYYSFHPKMQQIGFVDDWKQFGQAAYNDYIQRGLLTQLTRVELGKDLEDTHMRSRQWISKWLYEKGEGKVIERLEKDGKTYFKINDYERMHQLVGELLNETQRIKSEGDFMAAKELVETYGVKIDQELHRQVLERYRKLDIAPYVGFINPVLTPIYDDNNNVIDVILSYPKTFSDQMLHYSKEYNFLPLEN